MRISKSNDAELSEPISSPLLTIHRDEILDVLANLVIYPAYSICAIIVCRSVAGGLLGLWRIDSDHRLVLGQSILTIDLVAGILFLLAALPLASIAVASVEWRLGFKGRKKIIPIAILLFVILLNDPRTASIGAATTRWVTTLLLSEFALRRINYRLQTEYLDLDGRSYFHFDPLIALYALVLFAASVLSLQFAGILNEPWLQTVVDYFPWPYAIGVAFIGALALMQSVEELYREKRYLAPNAQLPLRRRLVHSLEYVAVLCFIIGSYGVIRNLTLTSVIGIAGLFLVANPRRVFSRHRGICQRNWTPETRD